MTEPMPPAVGHLLMIGLPGQDLDASTLSLIQEEGVHNFILFRRNVRDREQLIGLCTALRHACLAQGLPRPLISIDQEGGQVARLPPPFTILPEPRGLSELDNCQELLHDYATICARELVEVGINMNLAPVLDCCPSGQGLFMERRCLGQAPERVAELGLVVIGALERMGVAACAKHFPGLGSARLDPHLELPVVDRQEARLLAEDLLPFKRAAQAGVGAVMTSHAVYQELDHGLPATLSPLVIGGLLRKGCGYDGLVITDDMEMGAIEKFMAFPEAVRQAFKAGADLILICHDHQKVRRALAILRQTVQEGETEAGQADDSLRRQTEVLRRLAA